MIVAISAAFIAALILLNTTPLFYFEPSAYNRADEPPLFDPRAKEAFYENKGSGKLVILVHGFPGTPFEWDRVGRMLSKDYNVLIPRIYGFGTTPGFFKKTYFSQWYGSLGEIYAKYRKVFDDVTVCGLSFGGMLALRLAEDFGNSPGLAMRRIAVISAPVFLKEPGIVFLRLISWFIDEIKSRKSSGERDNDGADWVGFYDKFPAQLYSMVMGMNATRRGLSKIQVPAIFMHAIGDRTVPFENLDYIYNHVSSKDKRKFVFDLGGWKHRRHLLTMYNSSYEEVYRNIVNFISRGT